MTRTKRRKLTIGAIIDEEESEGRCMQEYFKVFLEINSNWIYIYKEPERTMGGLGGGVEMPSDGDLPTCQMVLHVLLTLQYTRSIYQKYGIAQSVYVPQGFSPVTLTTGTDGTMRTVEKKR